MSNVQLIMYIGYRGVPKIWQEGGLESFFSDLDMYGKLNKYF